MDRIIRFAVTIIITETWTIVWLPDDESYSQASPIVPEQPKTVEEPDELFKPP